MAAACIFILHPVPLLTLRTAGMHCVQIVRKDMQVLLHVFIRSPRAMHGQQAESRGV